jgi:hypothetical protein
MASPFPRKAEFASCRTLMTLKENIKSRKEKKNSYRIDLPRLLFSLHKSKRRKRKKNRRNESVIVKGSLPIKTRLTKPKLIFPLFFFFFFSCFARPTTKENPTLELFLLFPLFSIPSFHVSSMSHFASAWLGFRAIESLTKNLLRAIHCF